MSENLPKKIGFLDRLRYAFGGVNPMEETINNLNKEKQELNKKIQELEHENAKKELDLIKANENYRKSKEKDKVNDNVEIDSSDQLSNYLKEQLILENEKLSESLKQMELAGIPAEEQLKAIEKYQGKVMGMLYAYTEFDERTEESSKEVVQDKIQEIAQGISKGAQISFIDGFMHTRYQSCYYDDRDWMKYAKDNEFFSGGDLRTPETEGRIKRGYYNIREDFTTVKEKLETSKLKRGQRLSDRVKFKTNPENLVQETKGNAGYGVEDMFDR